MSPHSDPPAEAPVLITEPDISMEGLQKSMNKAQSCLEFARSRSEPGDNQMAIDQYIFRLKEFEPVTRGAQLDPQDALNIHLSLEHICTTVMSLLPRHSSTEIPYEDSAEFLPIHRRGALDRHMNQDPRKWISEIEQIWEKMPEARNESASKDDAKIVSSKGDKKLNSPGPVETEPQSVEDENSLDETKSDPRTLKGDPPSDAMSHIHEIGETSSMPYQMDNTDDASATQHVSQQAQGNKNGIGHAEEVMLKDQKIDECFSGYSRQESGSLAMDGRELEDGCDVDSIPFGPPERRKIKGEMCRNITDCIVRMFWVLEGCGLTVSSTSR
ncbi:hypothetical protein PG996_003414 [Apiospora saccharicola]|uniref:Uncharacterized protein n=1 Tax=Apiospora saccharicola TaxID=335842 RepID=A0ABR1W173_9PEZI